MEEDVFVVWIVGGTVRAVRGEGRFGRSAGTTLHRSKVGKGARSEDPSLCRYSSGCYVDLTQVANI